MEMNAANVAHFSSQAKFRQQKKMDEKGRFGELFTQEIQEIMDKAVPETRKSHKVRNEIV